MDVRGAAAPHIAPPVPAEIEDAELAGIEAETAATDDEESEDAEFAETDPEDDLADDPVDDAEDDTDADAAVGDPGLRYLAPRQAVRWLRERGVGVDLHAIRQLVAHDAGPAVAFFMFRGGRGRWKVRFDQLTQWAAFRFGLDLSP